VGQVLKPGCSQAPIAGASVPLSYTLQSACLNDIDPQVWFADVLARIKEGKANRS